MPKLPVLSSQDLVKVLAGLGYHLDHQTGSHMILRHSDSPHRRVTVPNHREIAKGTLLVIVREIGLTKEELIKP